MKEPSFTLGIEEEYLLVDPATGQIAPEPPEALFKACEEVLGENVSPEFLRCQIEVGTPVCETIASATGELKRLRRAIADCANHHGLAIIASSTHPSASWKDQQTTDKERYHVLASRMRDVIRRLLICGMHVHLGIEDRALRVDLMNQLSYFLPHLLALTTSSPFWEGRETGVKSYRLAVYDGLPRTGIPHPMNSADEWDRTVDSLVETGVIEDATKIWWDLRPSSRYPTLELRVPDICPRIEDTMCVAALYVSLARMLWRLRRSNQRWRSYSQFLVSENRWMAQRDGVTGCLIDFGRGEQVPYAELVEEILELVEEDADVLGCRSEVERARVIAAEGTSADRQIATYQREREAGGSEDEAFFAVVRQLIEETVEGVG